MNGLFALLAELNRPESVDLFRELTQRLPTVTPPLNPFTASSAAPPSQSAAPLAASELASSQSVHTDLSAPNNRLTPGGAAFYNGDEA
jgi:hypothetical protein